MKLYKIIRKGFDQKMNIWKWKPDIAIINVQNNVKYLIN